MIDRQSAGNDVSPLDEILMFNILIWFNSLFAAKLACQSKPIGKNWLLNVLFQ